MKRKERAHKPIKPHAKSPRRQDAKTAYVAFPAFGRSMTSEFSSLILPDKVDRQIRLAPNPLRPLRLRVRHCIRSPRCGASDFSFGAQHAQRLAEGVNGSFEVFAAVDGGGGTAGPGEDFHAVDHHP